MRHSVTANVASLQPGIPLLGVLARNWWMLLVNGAGALVFGGVAFAWPQVTLQALVILFGCYCLVDGFSALGASFTREEPATWWSMLFAGMVCIVAGVAAVLWPALTALGLLFVIATWAIIRGGFEIVAAFALRKTSPHTWLLAASGVVSILFGGFLVVRPGAGALAAIWIIGAFAVVRGILLVGFSLRLRAQFRRQLLEQKE
jgi:uncharacterized membrane protein HdeD (DUF308 family)